MTVLLVDGFDPYNVIADMAGAGWTIVGNPSILSITPFSEGQCLHYNSASVSSYTWGSNETTVYGAFHTSAQGTSSSSNYVAFSLRDGSTSQCTIRFNMDGSIGLYTGGGAGTLISTTSSIYPPATGTTGPYFSLQFKIVISNTVGSIEIRLNGASTNTITATNVNTRGGTTNSYVTGLALVAVGGASMKFDNLYLTNSGWLGEMRALQQRPTTISGTPNFSLNPTTINATLNTNATAVSYTANTAYFARYTAPYSGTVGSLTFLMNTNLTGNVKFAIYDSTGSGGTPGAVIRTTNAVNNPTTATNTATFSSSFSIIAGTLYYLAWDQDTTGSFRANSSGSTGYSLATSYASFPVSNPAVVTTILSSIFITIPTTLDNAAGVQDLIQDSDTTYIYTSAANVEDKYNLSSIATTYTVSAVQYFAMWKKTDAGFRTASLSVDANGSGDTNLITTTLLPFADYACTIKTMELDPTGAAWTPTNANNALLGVTAGS